MNLFFTPNQDRVFLCFLAVGVTLGFLYDIFIIKRIIFGKGFWVLFFDDLIYFALSTAIILTMIFSLNNGIIRWFEFFGCTVGFVLYKLTVSRAVIGIITRVVTLIKMTLIKLLSVAVLPIKVVAKPVNRLYNILKGKCFYHKCKRKINKFINLGM